MRKPIIASRPFGSPLPDSPHAVSVSMPRWQDVVDYEEGSERARREMKSGYPRFVYHPLIRELCAKAAKELNAEACLVLPSKASAEACRDYLLRQTAGAYSPSPVGGGSGRGQSEHHLSTNAPLLTSSLRGEEKVAVHALHAYNLHAVTFPCAAEPLAKAFWQHSGLIVSSRQAAEYLRHPHPDPLPLAGEGNKEKAILKQRIAALSGAGEEDVFLCPTGMAAAYFAHRAVCALKPGAKTIQLGFPYVDILKIQEQFGSGCHFIEYRDGDDYRPVAQCMSEHEIAAIFCEFPGNPLLTSVDLKILADNAHRQGIPLVVDDTLGTWLDVDIRPYADIAVTSLTKYFAGAGDVMAGALILHRSSSLYERLRQALADVYEDLLWWEDAMALERNARDFEARMRRIGQGAERLCDFLRAHPKVERVYFPKYTSAETYSRYRKPGGFHGGLFSFTLKNPTAAPAVYDALEVAKGPSLGTNFTLACPYTLLAHYHELDFAVASGVPAELIRVSVGLEPPEALIEAFARALQKG